MKIIGVVMNVDGYQVGSQIDGDDAITKSGDSWAATGLWQPDRRPAATLIGQSINVPRRQASISSTIVGHSDYHWLRP